jgi:hypothetical protein
MYYKMAGVPAKASMLAYQAARYGWLITIGIVVMDWLLPPMWHKPVGNFFVKIWNAVWPYLHSQGVASLVVFFVVLFGGIWVLLRLHRSKSGGTINVPFLWKLALLVVSVAAAWYIPWVVKTHREYDPWATKPAAAATITPTPPSAPPATPSLRKAPRHGHTHLDALDPSRLSEAGRAAYYGQ